MGVILDYETEKIGEGAEVIRYENGNKSWWLNGKRHREDGPAVEYADGYKAWYLNGKLHREDGPAVEHVGGSKEWWINDESVARFEKA